NSEQLVPLLDQIFARQPRDEWLKLFAQYDLPAAPINRLRELTDDPQIIENGYIVDFDHPKLGKIKIPGYPIHFSKTYAGTRSAAPEIGEHTESVLKEIGGYSEQQITQLRNEGVI
ncbi:MAG: CoA transferase, partial [Chloroflexi bacterium]|nr:CoA transferase [Chloroflexota bacterium]